MSLPARRASERGLATISSLRIMYYALAVAGKAQVVVLF